MASLQESFVQCIRVGRGNSSNSLNTVLGCNAGRAYTTGCKNVAIGHLAGAGSTSCDHVRIGWRAGAFNTGGGCNIFIGCNTGIAAYNSTKAIMIGSNSSYFQNNNSVGVGFRAFSNGCKGANGYSVGIGALTLCNSGFGELSVAVGFRALRATTGYRNTSIGSFSMDSNTTGTCNTVIGACSGRFYSHTNTTQLGYYTYQVNGATNRTAIGRYAVSDANVWVAWTNVSDERDKSDIQQIDDNLSINFIRKLRPVSYKMDHRMKYVNKCGYEFGQKDGTLKDTKESYGFIAQEIKSATDELGLNLDLVSYEEGLDQWNLKDIELLPFIVGSIKNLNTQIDEIENKLLNNG